jgi:hypothetical protein
VAEKILPDGELLVSYGLLDQSGNPINAGNPLPIAPTGSYASPNGKSIGSDTTLDSLFSDDFGGNAVSAVNWTVLDGGLPANANLGNGALTQGAIGSGVTGMSDAVSASALTVSMGTTNGAERWYLSNQVFAGKEDILVVLSRSQALAANSCFVGLVEVDPVTLVPLLNPNFAAEFTNRGGCEFGLTATATAFQAEAIGDSSAAKAAGVVGVATALTTTQEFLIEIDSRDITVSSRTIDNVTSNGAGASRVSSQAPNDRKLYKLLMRFRNVAAPASITNFVIARVLVIDNYEMRVQVSTGEGDTIGNKAIAVNLTSTVFTIAPSAGQGAATYHKLTSAATTNATSVKTSQGLISGGSLRNRAAAERYFKLYNKASAPTVGTDTPVLTIGLPAGALLGLADFAGAYGLRLATGIAYAITGAYADNDTTAVAAGDVDVNLIYT